MGVGVGLDPYIFYLIYTPCLNGDSSILEMALISFLEIGGSSVLKELEFSFLVTLLVHYCCPGLHVAFLF